YLDFKEVSVPVNPDSGYRRVFANTSTNKLSVRTSGGVTINLEYGDTEAIAAIEGEATLDLTGDITIAVGKTLAVDTINEKGAGTGVTIDGLLIKDKTIVDAWVDLTITSGVVTRTNLMHTLAGEGGAADNLVGISGGADGMLLMLHAVSDAVTITVKHNDTGGESSNGTRIFFSDNSDVSLDDIDDLLILIYDSALDSSNGGWMGLASSVGGHTKYTDAEAISAVEGESTLDLTGDVTIAGTKSLKVDVINEKDSGAGVTIENVTIKDGSVELHHGTDTISTDEITSPTGGYIIAAAQAGTTDDLDGIGGGANGRVIVVRADAGDTITVKHSDAGGGSGRKLLTNDNASVALVGNDEDSIIFMYDESLDSAAGAWFELSRSTGAGHTQAHGISDHTGHANWKLLYTDGSGDEQELSLGAAATYLRSAGASSAPTMSTIDADAISAIEGEATLDLTGDVTIAVGKSLAVDTIAEKGAGTGVTIDGTLIKDNGIVFIEAADHPIAAAATKGQLWVKTASPNQLWFTDDAAGDIQLGITLSHDYDVHSGGVPFAELEYDDATSNPLIDADSAADGTEDSAARKDHVHPKHHVKYLDSAAISAVEGEATLDLTGDVTIAVGKTLAVDTINEKGAGTGVTVDGLLIKDKTLVSTWNTLTVSAGQVTRTQMCHEISGEGGAADNLVGIAGGADGVFLYLHPTSDAVTITVKHMDVGGESSNGTRITFADNTDHDLDDIDDIIIFVYDSGLDSGNGAWIGLIPGGSAAGHALLSATHTDTSADAVTRGSIIIGNSTPAWDELGIGAANSALGSDGTDITWST
ncbi:hypothetical protein LCGC14_1899040, partial [marine sediment metagenome]